MADHRVTDLSYGHLGKASYDTEENEWKFSVNLDQSVLSRLHDSTVLTVGRILNSATYTI